MSTTLQKIQKEFFTSTNFSLFFKLKFDPIRWWISMEDLHICKFNVDFVTKQENSFVIVVVYFIYRKTCCCENNFRKFSFFFISLPFTCAVFCGYANGGKKRNFFRREKKCSNRLMKWKFFLLKEFFSLFYFCWYVDTHNLHIYEKYVEHEWMFISITLKAKEVEKREARLNNFICFHEKNLLVWKNFLRLNFLLLQVMQKNSYHLRSSAVNLKWIKWCY